MTMAAVFRAARCFVPGCKQEELGPLGRGLINETYLLAGTETRAPRVLQRLNTRVFREPRQVMENLIRVSKLLESKWRMRRLADPERHYLQLLPSTDGGLWWIDPDGAWWRCLLFIPGTQTIATVNNPDTAFQAGLAFGYFASDLADLPIRDLHCTLPGFHDTLGRLATLEQTLTQDPLGRAHGVSEEMDTIRTHADLAEGLQAGVADGGIPLRVVHNDTKVDNLLFDSDTGEALCVIDLDTVMPGRLIHDFGDLVRNAAAMEVKNGGMGFSLQQFSALVDGYLAGLDGSLTPTETSFLADAGPLLALELGARFLTDYLSGDTYFKTDYSGHNLDRCRQQLSLLDAMVRTRKEMIEVVTHYTTGKRKRWTSTWEIPSTAYKSEKNHV